MKGFSKYFLLCLFTVTFTVQGDVFWKIPFSKNKGVNIGSPEGLFDAINPDKLWDEPVVINGDNLKLGISLSSKSLAECLRELKNLYPNARHLINPSTALIETKSQNGYRNRIYLIEAGGKFPVVQFSMTIPPTKPKITDWPSALPLPSGAEPLTYMYFSDRKSYYGHFKCVYMGSEQEIHSSLLSTGWRLSSKTPNVGGEIFIKNNPRRILILRISDTKGSIYTRELE